MLWGYAMLAEQMYGNIGQKLSVLPVSAPLVPAWLCGQVYRWLQLYDLVKMPVAFSHIDEALRPSI